MWGVHADGGRVSDATPRPPRTTKRAPLVVASGVVRVPGRFRHMGIRGHTLGYSHEKNFVSASPDNFSNLCCPIVLGLL